MCRIRVNRRIRFPQTSTHTRVYMLQARDKFAQNGGSSKVRWKTREEICVFDSYDIAVFAARYPVTSLPPGVFVLTILIDEVIDEVMQPLPCLYVYTNYLIW